MLETIVVPLYEYVCANGHRTEVMHGIHAAGPEGCPVCGAAMRKAFVAPTFHFKGSGWAKMDRRTSSGTKKPASDATASEGAASDSATPKPATATSEGSASTSEPSSGPSTAVPGPSSKPTTSSPGD